MVNLVVNFNQVRKIPHFNKPVAALQLFVLQLLRHLAPHFKRYNFTMFEVIGAYQELNYYNSQLVVWLAGP